MASVNFISNARHIDPSRVGMPQVLPFQPLSPNGMTVLQSDQNMGNRAEWWSMDQKTVEVCQYPPRSQTQIIVPCIPEGDIITSVGGADGYQIYGKRYWDEWHSSVKFGQEFEIDASDIAGIEDYWHDPAGPAGSDREKSFFAILANGVVNWSRRRILIQSMCAYEYQLTFTVSLVRSPDQFDFGYD